MKVINWKRKKQMAKGMEINELEYAIKDCLEAVEAGVEEGYYKDEASIYRTELEGRLNKGKTKKVGKKMTDEKRRALNILAGAKDLKELQDSIIKVGNKIYGQTTKTEVYDKFDVRNFIEDIVVETVWEKNK